MSEQDLEKNTVAAYDKLLKNMPSIGFMSRKKRVTAYIQITKITEYMVDHDEVTEEGALFVLSLLMRKCSNFQKSAMMTALTLESIGKNVLSPIGLKFSLDVRKNLSLPSTHHTAEVVNSNESDT